MGELDGLSHHFCTEDILNDSIGSVIVTSAHKKAKTDAAKGKIFTKIGRELAVAAKAGADPSTNSKLADVIAKAKAANMV